MPTSTSFLASLDFLHADQRARLAADDLDTPTAFRHYEPAFFVAPPYSLTPGKAGKLIAAAREADVRVAAASTSLEVPDHGPVLRALGGPQHILAVRKLRELGVERTVIGDDDKVDVNGHASYVQDGSPAGPWYGPLRVVRLEDVGGKHPHHPRTGSRLTKGDAVQWIQLGRDDLVVAAAIFADPEILAGEGDRAVLVDVQSGGPMSQTARARLRDKATRERAEATVDGDAPKSASRTEDDRPVPATGNAHRDLPALLLQMFGSNELRTFLRYGPDGQRIINSLPERGSPFEIASAAVDVLRRQGQIDTNLRDRLIVERPRRADEIRSMFERFGVY